MKKAFVLLALVAGASHAQTIPSAAADTAFNRLMATVVGAGQSSINFASNGVPLGATSSAILTSNAGMDIAVARTGLLANAAGNSVPLNVTGLLTKARWLPMLKTAVKFGSAFVNPVSLALLALELGFDSTPSPTVPGKLDYSRKSGGLACASNCYEYNQPNTGNWFPTLVAACSAGAATVSMPGPSWSATFSGVTSAGVCQYLFTMPGDSFVGNVASSARSIPPYDTTTTTPVSDDEVVNAIAAASGWPTTSALSKTIAEYVPYAEPVQVDATTVTGPATSIGKTSVTNNVDGSKTTTATTYGHTYVNNVVTTTENAVTTVTNVDNSVRSVSNTTTTSPDAPPTKTQCELAPDSIGCAKLGTPDAPVLPKSDSGFTGITPIAFFSAATCPSPIAINALGKSFEISYQPTCNALSDYVKPVLVICAAFMAAFVFVGGFKV
jgi:hypothetical protein